MADAPFRILLQHLHRRAGPGAAGPDDAELLDRFVRGGDKAAFELLVWRHGTMVHNVCRRVLRDAHAAEDAFQATFLVLARKAPSIGRRQALAGWLYRVAYRVALRARSRPAPRPSSELPEPPAPPCDDVLWRDLRPVLDEEVIRLPEKYRLAVVLCYLSGLTTAEAARRLGVPRGTVLSRLAWARQRLRARLSLRGVAPAAGLLGALLASEAAPAAVVSAAARAALALAAGQPAAAAAAAVTLMEGVLRDMVLNKVRNGLLVVLGLVAVGLGVGLWATRPAAADPAERKRDEARAGASAPADTRDVPRAAEAPRPVGVWERKLVGKDGISTTLTLRIDADRIRLTQTITGKEGGMTGMVEGDYSVSRDYVLYGFVTGIDIPPEVAGNDTGKLQGSVLDQPFAFRYRVEADALTIRDIRLGGVKDSDLDEVQLLAGRYKKKATAAKDDDTPSTGAPTNRY
jgi:RNA polymerase sigma factor (sigma-70 family)